MTQEQGPQNQLSPEVLFRLGLTPEITLGVDAETQRQNEILKIIKRNGKLTFQQATNYSRDYVIQTFDPKELVSRGLLKKQFDDMTDEFIDGFKPTIHPLVRLIPSNLVDLPDAMYASIIESGEGQTKNKKNLTAAFLTGFGDAALEQEDYVTAVNAYDVASTSGILHDETVMARLKDIAQKDKVAGVRIAQAIQARISRPYFSS